MHFSSYRPRYVPKKAFDLGARVSVLGEELARAAKEQLQNDMEGWLQELLHFKVKLASFLPPSERCYDHACRVAELFVAVLDNWLVEDLKG